jgi:hypothetical protein
MIAWFKESEGTICLWKVWMGEQIVFHWMLEVKYDNDFLIKETHQVHSKARKIATSSGIDDIVVNAGFFIPYFNFSGFKNVFVYVDFGG